MTRSLTTMKQLHDRLSKLREREIVLDVRTREEFAGGHVPGSINIPHDEVTDRSAELKEYERIYLHCKAGKRAQFAAGALEGKGFTNLVCVSDGGFDDWVAAGYESESGA